MTPNKMNVKKPDRKTTISRSLLHYMLFFLNDKLFFTTTIYKYFKEVFTMFSVLFVKWVFGIYFFT